MSLPPRVKFMFVFGKKEGRITKMVINIKILRIRTSFTVHPKTEAMCINDIYQNCLLFNLVGVV